MKEIYFYNLFTPDEVKNMYNTLAKEHHASLTMMAIINAEYHIKLQSRNGQRNGKHTYYYNAHNEQAAIMHLQTCLESGIFGHMNGVEINIVGTWIWVYGDTYPQRAPLAGLGFARDYKRRMWYWKPSNEHQRSQRPMSGFDGAFNKPVEVMS